MATDKEQLRNKYLEKRNQLNFENIKLYSEQITRKILATDLYSNASTIFLYLSIGSEFDTWPLLKKILSDKKTPCVPVIKKKIMYITRVNETTEYIQGHFGIYEPVNHIILSHEQIDLALVPGLVFTQEGYRIGYGGGYYDKFLAEYKGISISAVFPGFIDNSFVPESFDRPVDYLIET